MATISKTADIAALAHQLVTHPDTVKGSAQDVSTSLGATVVCFGGFVEAAANTTPGSFLIQASASATSNEDWVTIGEIAMNAGTPDDEVLTAIEPAAETVLAVAATAGFAAGDVVYIQDIDTLANSEWGRLQEIVTNTSIDLIDGLTNEKSTAGSGCKAFNDATVQSMYVDLTGITRLRVVFQHEGATGANVHVKAIMVTGDSIG